MSSIVRLARATAPALAAVAAALLLAGAGAPAAAADDEFEVSLDCDPDPVVINQTAGCHVQLRNRTSEKIDGFRLTFLFQLAGLNHTQLALHRRIGPLLLPRQVAPGKVEVVDSFSRPLGAEGSYNDEFTVDYMLEFLPGAPAGVATIQLTASHSNTNLGSTIEKLTVKAGGMSTPDGEKSTVPTPVATTASPPPAAPHTSGVGSPVPVGRATGVALPAPDPASRQDSLVLFLVAGILVTAGIVILWMLLRAPMAAGGGSYRPPPYEPARRPAQVQPPLPRRTRTTPPPTQQFPVVPTDPTQEIDPRRDRPNS